MHGCFPNVASRAPLEFIGFATWLRATPTHELQKGLHGLAACGVQLFAKFLAELLQHLLALTANLMGLKDNRTRKFNEAMYLLDTRFLRFGLFVASSLWKGVSPVSNRWRMSLSRPLKAQM